MALAPGDPRPVDPQAQGIGRQMRVFTTFSFPSPSEPRKRCSTNWRSVLNSAIQGASKTAAKIRESVLADVQKFQATQNGDKEFGQAIQDCGKSYLPIEPFVTGKEGRTPNPESLHVTGAQLFGGFSDSFFPPSRSSFPFPILQEQVADSGHTRFFPDTDGIFRYYPTVIAYSGLMIPHLSLQVARVFHRGSRTRSRFSWGSHVEVGNRYIPISDSTYRAGDKIVSVSGFAVVNYCGSKGIFPTFSASDVLNNRADPQELQGIHRLDRGHSRGHQRLEAHPLHQGFPRGGDQRQYHRERLGQSCPDPGARLPEIYPGFVPLPCSFGTWFPG